MRRGVAILFLVAYFGVLHASQRVDSTSIYNINEIVVTATRIPQEIKNIPQRIDVILLHRLNSNPSLSADDALNQISGVLQQRTSGILSRRTLVSLRGMGDVQGRTLIMIDGVPMNTASTGYANLNRISPELLERIEIVKGPGSSLYGGNAMGGIVNLITRMPQKTLEGSASFSGGSLGTFITHGYIGGNSGMFNYSVYGDYGRSDGYNTYSKEERSEKTIPVFMKEYSIGTTIGVLFSPYSQLQISGRYYDGKRGNGTRYFPQEKMQPTLDLYNRFREMDYMINYKAAINGFHITLSGNYSQEKYGQLNSKGNSLYDVNCIRRDWRIWSVVYKTLSESNIISGGVEVKGGYVDGRDVYRTSTDIVIDRGKSVQTGLWIQDEINLNDKFRLVPSLRFDIAKVYDGGFFTENSTSISNIYKDITGKLGDNTWTAFSPKICAQYKLTDNSRIFFNVACGFRPGALEDMVWAGLMRGVMILCNTRLKPEHVASFELGADFHIGKSVSISPSVFFTHGWNYIFDVNTGDSVSIGEKVRPIFKKSNIGKVAIYGVEMDVDAEVNDRINLFGNITYHYTEILRGAAIIGGKEVSLHGERLSYVPRLKLALGGTWHNNIVNTNLSYVLYSRQTTDAIGASDIKAYGIFDAKLWHNFAQKIEVSINCRNMFDKRYIDSGQLSIGRMIFGEVRMRF